MTGLRVVRVGPAIYEVWKGRRSLMPHGPLSAAVERYRTEVGRRVPMPEIPVSLAPDSPVVPLCQALPGANRWSG